MTEKPRFGPANPHPFAVKKTELIWEGNYDGDGKRVAPLRVALPFQTVEYTDAAGNLRYYEPDFVAVLGDSKRYIVETKGQEDVNVANKDRAAAIWCENAPRRAHRSRFASRVDLFLNRSGRCGLPPSKLLAKAEALITLAFVCAMNIESVESHKEVSARENIALVKSLCL
jgi:hypothetical protein